MCWCVEYYLYSRHCRRRHCMASMMCVSVNYVLIERLLHIFDVLVDPSLHTNHVNYDVTSGLLTNLQCQKQIFKIKSIYT